MAGKRGQAHIFVAARDYEGEGGEGAGVGGGKRSRVSKAFRKILDSGLHFLMMAPGFDVLQAADARIAGGAAVQWIRGVTCMRLTLNPFKIKPGLHDCSSALEQRHNLIKTLH
jgi:hypothetical protein